MKIGIVIVAGGSSNRMKEYGNKLLINILGVPIINRTINVFINIRGISEIVLVCKQSDINEFRKTISTKYNEKIKIISGGSTRQESVFNGIKKLSKDTDIVLIHDGARPLISEEVIKKCIQKTPQLEACCVGVKSKDTIKIINEEDIITKTPNRSTLVNIQTPQCFTYKLAYEMHDKAVKENIIATDDSFLAEKMGYDVHIIYGDYNNIKITTKEDLDLLKFLLINR